MDFLFCRPVACGIDTLRSVDIYTLADMSETGSLLTRVEEDCGLGGGNINLDAVGKTAGFI